VQGQHNNRHGQNDIQNERRWIPKFTAHKAGFIACPEGVADSAAAQGIF
jgi:hypothetical protein